jgi:outer membrane receptor for ferric coprogen and ferric-rhodotorulic acid
VFVAFDNTDEIIIDPIELIKGPSAIFIGNAANIVGCVHNEISKTPTDYNFGTLTIQVGLFDADRAALDLGGPITKDQELCGFLPARTLADGMIQYATPRNRYQINIDNIFDTTYIYASRSNQVIVPGAPTNTRFSVTYIFL